MCGKNLGRLSVDPPPCGRSSTSHPAAVHVVADQISTPNLTVHLSHIRDIYIVSLYIRECHGTETTEKTAGLAAHTAETVAMRTHPSIAVTGALQQLPGFLARMQSEDPVLKVPDTMQSSRDEEIHLRITIV